MNLNKEFLRLTHKERCYQSPIPIIGLTGGIASGKSSVTNILRSKKLPVICADELVHQIYKLPESLMFIEENFKEAMVNKVIDFKRLREIFFNQKSAQEKIETFIYSKLPGQFQDSLNKLSNPSFVIYDVPLLFEKDLNNKMDISVLVYCKREQQINRLIKRDNIKKELAEKILSKQLDIEIKKKKADYLIDNSNDLESLEEQVTYFVNKFFV